MDIQVSIRTVGYSKRKSGQHIVKHIVSAINSIRRKGSTVEICWIPAHVGLCSHKGANKAAKKVTGWMEIETDEVCRCKGKRHFINSREGIGG